MASAPVSEANELWTATTPDGGDPAPREASDSSRRARRLTRWLGRLVALWLLLRVLAVNVGGVISNDSIGYFGRAEDPLAAGLIAQGYRQVAYPLWLQLTEVLGVVGGWDRIFAVSVLQRILLIVGVLTVWWALRFWSVPVLLAVTSSSYVIHADFVLPEGLLIPGSLVASGLAAGVATARPFVVRHQTATLATSAGVALGLASVKLQYAAFLFLTLAIAWTFWRRGGLSWQRALVIVATPFVLVGLLAAGQAVENRTELGALEPVSERARAEWYGAWQAVFTVAPDNQSRAELAQFYDEGDLYVFLHGIEQTEPSYLTRASLIRERTAAMFRAADTSARREQLKAFIGALQGGRTDDLVALVDKALTATHTDSSPRLVPNRIGRVGGELAVLDAINNGETTAVLSTGSLLSRFRQPFDDFRPWKRLLVLAGLSLTAGALLLPGRHRAFMIAGLAVIVSTSAALGSAYIDNARYLVGASTLIMITATVGVRAGVLTWVTRSSPKEAQ